MHNSRGARLLREWRAGQVNEAGKPMRQEDAARLFECSVMEVSKYERGVNSPGRRRANKIEQVTVVVLASSWDEKDHDADHVAADVDDDEGDKNAAAAAS